MFSSLFYSCTVLTGPCLFVPDIQFCRNVSSVLEGFWFRTARQTGIMVSSNFSILCTISSITQKLWPPEIYQDRSRQMKSGTALKEVWFMLGCVRRLFSSYVCNQNNCSTIGRALYLVFNCVNYGTPTCVMVFFQYATYSSKTVATRQLPCS